MTTVPDRDYPLIDNTGAGRRRRLVLVGGGPSSACLVLRLADELARDTPRSAPAMEIVLVDRDGQAGGGDPHATGISPALLLNDKLATLDSTGIGFGSWLHTHRERWLPWLAAQNDQRVARWLRRNREAIERHDFDGLFLPRALFGDFIRHRFAQARNRLAGTGIPMHLRQAAVSRVRPGPHGRWAVALDGIGDLAADAVLLAPGSLDPAPVAMAGHPRYFSYRRARDVDTMQSELSRLLAGRPPQTRRVVVLGSAAAACEVLYCLEGSPSVDSLVEETLVVSSSGRLPEGLPSGNPVPYVPRRLPELTAGWAHPARRDAGSRIAAATVAALVGDISDGWRQRYTIVDMLDGVLAAFGAAFGMLPPAEKRRFVEDLYRVYRETVRHISADYAAAVDRLRTRGPLTVQAGTVTELSGLPSGDLAVRWRQGDIEQEVTAAAVFDCRGFAGVHDCDQPVVTDLLATGVAAANACGRGLQVNERFEAAPGLFVLGPLLAGTSNGTDHIWTMETVHRIYALAGRAATATLERLDVSVLSGT